MTDTEKIALLREAAEAADGLLDHAPVPSPYAAQQVLRKALEETK